MESHRSLTWQASNIDIHAAESGFGVSSRKGEQLVLPLCVLVSVHLESHPRVPYVHGDGLEDARAHGEVVRLLGGLHGQRSPNGTAHAQAELGEGGCKGERSLENRFICLVVTL
jgi:hypothetical protein